MRPSAPVPLFRIDPGWLFLLAGAALLAAAILIPAHRELLALRGELVRQETREQVVFERLRAYDEFLAGVREADPAIVRRLAMAHLNTIPAGEESLLLTPGVNRTVGEWVDASVPPRTVTVPPYPDTVLSRWALGPGRLWLLAGSATLLFMGLMFGPIPSAATGAEPDALAAAIAGRVSSAAEPDDEPAATGEPDDAEARTEIAEVEDEAEAEVEFGDDVDAADGELGEEADVSDLALEVEDRVPFDAVAATVELSPAEAEAWASSAPDGCDPGIGTADWSMPSGESDSAATCDDIALALLDRADPDLDGPRSVTEGAD